MGLFCSDRYLSGQWALPRNDCSTSTCWWGPCEARPRTRPPFSTMRARVRAPLRALARPPAPVSGACPRHVSKKRAFILYEIQNKPFKKGING